ncbi:MAG TPA: extracellular solute-binding protein, partial [Beijerinckiaceae bacterium]|nr:extracellular solute-binding protein [Beijerinckiaceae bacterium]
MLKGQFGSLSALMLAGALLAPASIPRAHAATAADIADLSGPDRMQKLIDGAKKEGGLELYSSATVEDMAPIIAGFEKKYGLKVRVWRGSATDIRQRAVTEAQSGHSELDVVEAAGPEVEALQREHLLQEIKSPTLADLIPGSLPPHKQWALDRISVITAAYNTNVITKAQAPKSYDDLIDPKWKGKLGIEAIDSDVWLMGVAAARGEQATIDLFRKIVAVNGMSLRTGHTQLANFVASGEVPLALTVYGYKVDQLVDAGAPVQGLPLAPLLGLPTAVAVAQRAPDPYSAVLFWEYILTDGQKDFAKEDNVPSNRTVKEPPAGLTLVDSG